MEVGKVRTVGRLEDISLKVHICDLLNLENLLFIDLLESVVAAMKVDQGNDPVRAASQVFDQFKVLHGQVLEF